MEQTLQILTFIALIAYILFDKFIIPKIDSCKIKLATEAVSTTIDIAQKIDIIIKMASQFVVLAKKEMTDATGEEKRNWVIEKLKTICDGIDIVLDDDSLRAINEGAYAEMKSKETIESTSEK